MIITGYRDIAGFFIGSITRNISYIYDATGAKLKKIATEGSSLIETEYAGNYVYKNGNLEFFNTSEGYVEQHSDGFKYIYQYKDHLGNIRLSYNKGGNKTFLNDTFDSSTDGWGGGAISAVNGRLGVKVRYTYSGTNKKITQSFSAGETVKIRLKLDANGKGYKMRVLVNEINAANASTGWYSAGDASEGNFEATYQIKQDASKLNIKLGLTSSIAAEEEIYLDDISVVQETEEGIIVQEEKNYYPFGLEHKGYNNTISGREHSYKFNGIEQEQSLGLDLYEMDLRQYDPAIARWTSIDPVTHHSMSTYNAFDNNPIYWADPSGANSVNSIQEAWDATPEDGSSTWNSDGNGGFCDDCPKEGQTRPEMQDRKGGLRETGGQEYYHSGGIDGSKAGWYSQSDYLKKIEPIAADVAGYSYYPGSIEWLSNIEAVEGFENFLLNYSSALIVRRENASAFSASGLTRPMGFDSPFFMGALGLAGKALGFGATSEFTTVGRWMSEAEYNAMKSGSTVLEGAGGQTFVTQGGSSVFPSAARGSIYAEFQVPTNSLLQGGKAGWFKLIGPNASRSQQFLLQKQGGQLLPQYRNLSRILQTK